MPMIAYVSVCMSVDLPINVAVYYVWTLYPSRSPKLTIQFQCVFQWSPIIISVNTKFCVLVIFYTLNYITSSLIFKS